MRKMRKIDFPTEKIDLKDAALIKTCLEGPDKLPIDNTYFEQSSFYRSEIALLIRKRTVLLSSVLAAGEKGTKAAVAKRLDISLSNLTQWGRRGAMTPSVVTLEKTTRYIIDALSDINPNAIKKMNKTLHYFWFGTRPVLHLPPRVRAYNVLLDLLPSAERKAVNDFCVKNAMIFGRNTIPQFVAERIFEYFEDYSSSNDYILQTLAFKAKKLFEILSFSLDEKERFEAARNLDITSILGFVYILREEQPLDYFLDFNYIEQYPLLSFDDGSIDNIISLNRTRKKYLASFARMPLAKQDELLYEAYSRYRQSILMS